jgi:hypothetical protein
VQEQQLGEQQQVSDEMRADGEADGREEPDGHGSEKGDLGVAGVKGAEDVCRDEQGGGDCAEPQHESGIAGHAIGAVDEELGEPLMRHIGVVMGGEGEGIRGGDGVGGPDDLAGAEMPPHVGVVEAAFDGEHGEDGQGRGEQYRKGAETAQPAGGA